ncbi:MAG TPA: menaquinone biosynthesis protein [Vicinamibacterales bacterium]|jgi:chorismate dehydratase|nr:menaquinone biosynthesis protein [Vicinamibacterales bacterium]
MTAVRLGAVGYLNARPLVVGLDALPQFDLRFDLPSECARLLAAGEVDLGLVPSIEYLRDDSYQAVPDVAIASKGPVLSVALYTTRPVRDVRTILMDTSSRTSVALTRVLCARLFKIAPAIDAHAPDLEAMLSRADAALVIGDKALLAQPQLARLASAPSSTFGGPDLSSEVEKIDLGEAWSSMTGLPFVWAFWVGRAGALRPGDVAALQAARDAGVGRADQVAREYFRGDPEHQELGVSYLRNNIKYYLGADERAGLELFYRYAAEIGVVSHARPLRFY